MPSILPDTWWGWKAAMSHALAFRGDLPVISPKGPPLCSLFFYSSKTSYFFNFVQSPHQISKRWLLNDEIKPPNTYLCFYKLEQCFPNCCLPSSLHRKPYHTNDICLTQWESGWDCLWVTRQGPCLLTGPPATISQNTCTWSSGHPSWEALLRIQRALPWVLL